MYIYNYYDCMSSQVISVITAQKANSHRQPSSRTIDPAGLNAYGVMHAENVALIMR